LVILILNNGAAKHKLQYHAHCLRPVQLDHSYDVVYFSKSGVGKSTQITHCLCHRADIERGQSGTDMYLK